MIRHEELSGKELTRLIKKGVVRMAGNRRLKIYGQLQCRSGKRMQPINRVFFKSETEAIDNGYRPCGHCMPKAYQAWNYLKDK